MSHSSITSKASPLDHLIAELLNYSSEDVQSITDLLFTRDQKAITAIPVRYRIIGLGFVKGLSLSEVNDKLIANGCEKLYGRSVYEATLIYAFTNRLSYEEWKTLLSKCEAIRAAVPANAHLSGRAISLNDIINYVDDNSDLVDEVFMTQHITQEIGDSISGISSDKAAILKFMSKNIQRFSMSRECTRYYFCKYLMYYLETRRDNYLNIYKGSLDDVYDTNTTRQRLLRALDMLSVFRAETKLTRKKLTPAEALSVINDSALSLSEIYDEYQRFYFEYTSIDWLTVLLERYGDFSNLTKGQKNMLASTIRKMYPSMRSLSDDDVMIWQQQEIEKKERDADEKYSVKNGSHPAASRTGESFLRKVLHGDLDLDRTTFLSFLLFFDKGSNTPSGHRINEERLQDILTGCGFPLLNDTDPFDAFFIEYMNADDPMVFLIQEAEIMAMSEENFYLYKTYLSSKDNDKEFSMVANITH